MKPRTVRYEVGQFGLAGYHKGDIVDALLILRYDDRGVLLHPPTEEACASLELAKYDGELWHELSGTTYLNLPDNPDDYEALLGILKRADR